MGAHTVTRFMLTGLGWAGIVAGAGCLAIGLDGRYGPLATYIGLAFSGISGGAVLLGLGAIIEFLADIAERVRRATAAAARAEAVTTGSCPECGTRRFSNASECKNCGYGF